MRRECRERFPRHQLQRKLLVNDADMHHGRCVTHVPWCTSGSLTHGGGETFPAFPAHGQPVILRIWQEAHPIDSHPFRSMTIGPPIRKIRIDLENARSKVKVKGALVRVASNWLISILFHINWTNNTWYISNRNVRLGKNGFEILRRNSLKGL